MKKSFLLNVMLAAVLGVLLLALVLLRTFAPAVILPGLNIPAMTLISLAVLLAEHFLAPQAERKYPLIFLFSAVSFALLPLAAGFIQPGEWWMYALAGGAVFTAATWIFGSAAGRISSGNGSKAALFLTALGIYLAAQCFCGIFL